MVMRQVHGNIAVMNYPDVEAYLREAAKRVSDLRPVLITIASDFYKDNKQLLALKGPGKYPDFKGPKSEGKVTGRRAASDEAAREMTGLTPYGRRKLKKWGFLYPLLKGSGKLLASVTQRGVEGSVFQLGMTSLVVGTSIEYGIYHQSSEPRKVMPYRPFVINKDVKGGFYDKWKTQSARWARMIETFMRRRWK
jgi:phage gpG-like protein